MRASSLGFECLHPAVAADLPLSDLGQLAVLQTENSPFYSPRENALHCCIIFRAKIHSFKIIPENERLCCGQALKHLILSKMSTDKRLKMIWTQIFRFTESLIVMIFSFRLNLSQFKGLPRMNWPSWGDNARKINCCSYLFWHCVRKCANSGFYFEKMTLKFKSSPIMHMMIASVWFPSPNGPPSSLPLPETAGC